LSYLSATRQGETIHSPETCLLGAGWEFKNAGRKSPVIDEKSGKTVTRVMGARMENAGQRQIVYYWFAQRGRINTSLSEVKIYNFWDALTRLRWA
jgi:EpsI family protein